MPAAWVSGLGEDRAGGHGSGDEWMTLDGPQPPTAQQMEKRFACLIPVHLPCGVPNRCAAAAAGSLASCPHRSRKRRSRVPCRGGASWGICLTLLAAVWVAPPLTTWSPGRGDGRRRCSGAARTDDRRGGDAVLGALRFWGPCAVAHLAPGLRRACFQHRSRMSSLGR